jgi:hypothetical protein
MADPQPSRRELPFMLHFGQFSTMAWLPRDSRKLPQHEAIWGGRDEPSEGF